MEVQAIYVWIKKRLHVLAQLFYDIVIETNKNKYINQYLARKMSQYQKHVDNYNHIVDSC